MEYKIYPDLWNHGTSGEKQLLRWRSRIAILPGQYYDEETGLHYNWNRYYNAETGRFITADPIGLDGGINIYNYVFVNPVNTIDPNGLDPVDDIGWKDLYDLIDTINKAAKDAAENGVCDPCMQVISINRATCQCVMQNKTDPDAIIDCFCWYNSNPSECKSKIKDDIINIFKN